MIKPFIEGPLMCIMMYVIY